MTCIHRSVGSVLREVTDPLVHPDEPSLTWGVVYTSGVPAQKGCGAGGARPEEATKLVRELELLSCADRLRVLGLFREDAWRPHSTFSVYKETREGLLVGNCRGGRRGNGFKLRLGLAKALGRDSSL